MKQTIQDNYNQIKEAVKPIVLLPFRIMFQAKIEIEAININNSSPHSLHGDDTLSHPSADMPGLFFVFHFIYFLCRYNSMVLQYPLLPSTSASWSFHLYMYLYSGGKIILPLLSNSPYKHFCMPILHSA